MNDAVATVVIAISLGVGLGMVGLAIADRRPLTWVLGGLLLVEAAALVQVVWAVVAVIRGSRPDSAGIFAGYALASLAVPPLGAFWALAEKSKWGTAAAGISCLVLAVATLRLQQVWG